MIDRKISSVHLITFDESYITYDTQNQIINGLHVLLAKNIQLLGHN